MDDYFDTSFSYDREKGELSVIDAGVTEVVLIRQAMVDAMIRQACIVELERLGYTVIPPEET